MSHPDPGDVVFYLLALMLPLSGLLARRLPIGHVARLTALWAGIFAGLLVAVTVATRAGFTSHALVNALGLSDQTVTGTTVAIPKSADGHFWTTVTIGPVSQRMLIDSGATTTAISPETARAAGIDASTDRFGTIIETANGSIIARRAIAPSVRIGPIEARNLEIVVGDTIGDGGVVGMNFLSSLKSWRVEGDHMVLEPHKP